MTPLRQRIVTLLIVAGSHGMSGDDLFRIVYDGRVRGTNRRSYVDARWRGRTSKPHGTGGQRGPGLKPQRRSALKELIYRINKEHEHYHIVGSTCPGGWYRIITKSEWTQRTSNRPSPSPTDQ